MCVCVVHVRTALHEYNAVRDAFVRAVGVLMQCILTPHIRLRQRTDARTDRLIADTNVSARCSKCHWARGLGKSRVFAVLHLKSVLQPVQG